MATTWPLPDQQQPQQQVVNNPEAVSSAWHNSGSIGPFFAVISVLTVLAFLSCVLGRVCTRREATASDPLESIKHGRTCLSNEWLKRACQRCMDGFDVEIRVIKAKIFGGGRHDCKAQDGVVQNHPSA